MKDAWKRGNQFHNWKKSEDRKVERIDRNISTSINESKIPRLLNMETNNMGRCWRYS